jgi:hypothetical protein
MRRNKSPNPLILVSLILLFLSCLSGCVQEQDTDVDDQSNQKPIITEDTVLEQVILNGLTLNGSQEQIYEDKELIVRGNIELKDNSKLEIINSKFTVDIDYNKQYALVVKDNATLHIDNVFYQSIDWRWYNFEYFDNAIIRIVDFENENAPWQTVEENVDAEFIRAAAGITIFANDDEIDDPFSGSILINGSNTVYFEIDLKPEIDYVFEFPNGYVEEWHPDYFEGTIDVYNSTITNLDIDIWAGVDVIVKNTNPLELGWIFGDGFGQAHSVGTSAEIVGLKNMTYDDFTFEANNASLQLVNTTVTAWWPIVTGEFELTVRDCHMIDPWAYNSAKFNVYDSFIFYMSATNQAVVEIHDSVVEDSLLALENSTIMLYNTSFTGETAIDPGASIFIDGVLVEYAP